MYAELSRQIEQVQLRRKLCALWEGKSLNQRLSSSVVVTCVAEVIAALAQNDSIILKQTAAQFVIMLVKRGTNQYCTGYSEDTKEMPELSA